MRKEEEEDDPGAGRPTRNSEEGGVGVPVHMLQVRLSERAQLYLEKVKLSLKTFIELHPDKYVIERIGPRGVGRVWCGRTGGMGRISVIVPRETQSDR